MKKTKTHYEHVAALFDYPQEGYSGKAEDAQSLLDEHYPAAGKLLQLFMAFLRTSTLREQQELFIRSFDVQAVTTLDLGYVMFGDDYKRGELLVNLNREHREVQNDCGVELSDNLANVLRLLPKIKDEVIAEELVVKIIAPALKKMIQSFEPEQIELKDKFYQKQYKTLIERPDAHYTIYQQLLKVLYMVLKEDFQIEEKEPVEKSSDFLKNIDTEVTLEG